MAGLDSTSLIGEEGLKAIWDGSVGDLRSWDIVECVQIGSF